MRRYFTTHAADWSAVLALSLAVIVFHWRGLQPGYAFLPIDNLNNNRPWRTGPFVLGDLQNQLIGDPIYQSYPFLITSLDSIRGGHWPIWNPNMLLGHPALGDPLYQTFYPVGLGLGLIFGAARGLTLGAVIHVLLAALLTYAWLRTQRRSPPAAALGALTYALSGFMLTWLETPFWVSTLSWLPGVLWGVERALQTRHWRDVALAALILGCATLGGQFSFVAVFDVFLAAYGIWRAMAEPLRWRWSLAVIGGTVGLGTALALIQILPFAEALPTSHRAGGVPFLILPVTQLITVIVPDFYGNPSTTGAYWGAANYSEAVLYAGLVALFLGLVAAMPPRRGQPIFWLLAASVIGYFACGGPGVAALGALPGFNFIAPNRSFFLLPLLLAALAAAAMDDDRLSARAVVAALLVFGGALAWAVIGNWGDARRHWTDVAWPVTLALLGGVGCAGVLLAPSRRTPIHWLLVAVAFIDLYLFGHRYNPALPISTLPQPTRAIQFLQANAAGHRVATLNIVGDIVFGPNTLTAFGLNDLTGYSSLLPARLVKLVRAGDPGSMGYNANTISLGRPPERLLDLMQARFLVTTEPSPPAEPKAEHIASGCESATSEITRAQPVAGNFAVHDFAINRLDLSFRALSVAPPVTLTVQMWDGPQRARLVLQSQLDTAALQDGSTNTFFFAPEADAPGQSYGWEVATMAEHSGWAVCANRRGEPEFSVYGVDRLNVFEGELFITERIPPPRAYVVYATETIPDDDRAIARLLDPAFDLGAMAVTATPIAFSNSEPAPATRARVTRDGDTAVTVVARAERDGLLVLADYAYPGWAAYVDGMPAEIVRANLLWRGVRLPVGEHTVEFKFEPRSLQMGAALSGLALAVIVAIPSASFFHERRRR